MLVSNCREGGVKEPPPPRNHISKDVLSFLKKVFLPFHTHFLFASLFYSLPNREGEKHFQGEGWQENKTPAPSIPKTILGFIQKLQLFFKCKILGHLHKYPSDKNR